MVGQPGGPIDALRIAIRGDPRASGLKKVAAFMLRLEKDAFVNQGRSGVDWPPRAVPNRIGLLLDLRDGAYILQKRWQPRPAGRDSGDLIRSLFAEVDENTVRWGSRLPYSGDFVTGGRVTIAITQDMRLAFKRTAARRPDVRRALFGVIDRPSFVTEVPGRNFARPSQQELAAARKIFVEEFERLGGVLSQHGYSKR